MKRTLTLCAFLCALCAFVASAAVTNPSARAFDPPLPGRAAQAEEGKLIYADFENAQDKRPLSKRGGHVQLVSYQESTPSRFKGMPNASPPSPELVQLKPNDPNHAIAFNYELSYPNQYAGVGVEVNGLPDKEGKPAAEDASGYKFLVMQVYATGVKSLRVEIFSRGQGLNLTGGFPQMSFKVTPGFNTYKIPLSSLSQPSWVQTRVSPKDVLRKLTGVSLTAFCEQCTPMNGLVVVDNIVFEK